ncbi:alpha-mannosidase [Microbacterium hibisci]|uniref:alpha-mannosidase n=1 Tax=Microbacterium hibisci TaxID=2036000 RepID=UPI0019454A74|nr:glycoside hydrolase family 38 C-terminal domain-containing protein [Microbacterium hibisci]
MRRAGIRTDPGRVADRISRLLDESLRAAVYAKVAPLDLEAWEVPGEPVPFADAAAQAYAPFTVGTAWGRPWSTLWLRARGRVPEDWPVDDRYRVEVVVDPGFDDNMPGFQCEGLVFRPDGTIVKAISPRNSRVAVVGRDIDLYLELAGNPSIPPESHWRATRMGDAATAGDAPQYRLRRLDVALVDRCVWELLQDIETVRGLASELPPTAPRHAQLWAALDRMLDVVDPDDVHGTASAGRDALAAVLAAPAAASAHTVLATGHAHIDTAWLWPVRETVRKCARSFSNALALMEEDADFRFVCSQAQQLAWVKSAYPELFERIREKVASGQFVPVGSQWVEPDTNMPNGEATIRQLTYGKRFFLEEFGVETREVWLPDTFGYSAALPQIMRLAGVDWFMTQKISWNQTNAMPHHTFLWEGLDGTRIFTHFPPIETYNAQLSPAELAHAERTFADHDAGTVSLAPFGWGDGGGGPTREMVAAARRQADLDGSPRVVLGAPADFYARASTESEELPVWRGEMYLELHRGTLTSQLRTKQGNRRSEELLHEAELWAATAAVRRGTEYPYDELDRLWKRVLMLQFHDILPGSSIAWVHREAEADHEAIQRDLQEIVARSVTALAATADVEAEPASTPGYAVNSAAVAIDGVAAFSIGTPAEHPAAVVEETADGWLLRNGTVSAIVDRRGLIVSLAGADAREVIPEGEPGGLLRLHRDSPDKWDAWDIDRHYRHNAHDLIETDEISAGTDAGTVFVRATRSFGSSSVTQTVALGPGRAALDISLDIDWQERGRLLKLVFPLDLHADETSTETQFGHLRRPTHRNTSWDEARFEVSGQRWLHLDEAGFGAAIANDSSYGHSVDRVTRPSGQTTTTVEMSVLRGARFPDPNADRGRHRVRYSLRPAATIGDAREEGRRMSHSLRFIDAAEPVEPLVSSSSADVIVETVKLADDRTGDVVVRLYEASGGRRRTTIRPAFAADAVELVDLLERTIVGRTRVGDDPAAVTLTLRPFEIVTLRYRRAT